jgi:hypothetical protein
MAIASCYCFLDPYTLVASSKQLIYASSKQLIYEILTLE